MSEERTQITLTAVEMDTMLMLLDRELEATKHLHELATKLRASRSRPTSPSPREADTRRA